MAPGGGGKRKRGDRTYSQDSLNDGNRPSPHRPASLSLAQHNHQGSIQHGYGRESPNRGGRRLSRGGRGPPPRSPHDSPNTASFQQRQPNSVSMVAHLPTPSHHRNEVSHASEAKLSGSTASTSTQTPPPTALPPAYMFEYLTDDIRRDWKGAGMLVLVDRGKRVLKESDVIALGLIFQEVIRAGIDGIIDASDAGNVIRAMLEPEDENRDDPVSKSGFRGPSLFLDSLSLLSDDDMKGSNLKTIVLSTGIPAAMMRQELDTDILSQLGLIRNTFVRMGIRNQTNFLYRQSNYNLLREETEGYSKLVTELFTTSGNEPPTAEVVGGTFERVKAMIGTFDLDVGRVLDITLDVFAAVLVKHYRFFVKYLRASSWWPQTPCFEVSSQSEDSDLQNLPKWAQLWSHGQKPLSEVEKVKFAHARAQRDTKFWARVREIGLPAFFELGGRKVDASVAARSSPAENQSDGDEDQKWMDETGTLPPTGNKIVAQILGFKLRFYNSSARDGQDTLPPNLIYLAALLIKIGFISLRDLYPHIWPADESMEAVKEQKMREKAERDKLNRPGGGAVNALMAAGALSDDTVPASIVTTTRTKDLESSRNANASVDAKDEKSTGAPESSFDSKEELPEPSDQKVQLLKSFLCIGALPEALFILGRFPWLPDAFPDLPEHIHRILHHCLSRVYEPLQPLKDHPVVREPQKVVDPDQAGVPRGSIRRIDQPSRKVLRWAQLDKLDTNEGTDFRFYWEDWADNVPICQTVDDVFLLCSTLLNHSGLKIGQDPALLTKLARIGSHSLASDLCESNRSRWIDLSKRLLVPALSLTRHNSGTVGEVWGLIKQFPTTVRFNIYAEWFTGQTSRLPDMKSAFDQCRAETKDVMKRISKTNLKPMARALAKVATASPGIVFTVAINQIESYENLVEVIVECARYFTDLGYDVLTWSLMNSLGARGRNRVQADGMLTSKWLAALSLFSGKVFKRYSVMNPTPILQYVADQLRKGNSTDLIVLEEMTTSMAGIVSDTNFNDAQVVAMAGGSLLQSQTMLQLLDRRHEPGMSGTAKRLMKSLVGTKLAGQLLISIAQERQTCIYKIPEPDAHLKLLGNLFDEIHRVLTQYLDLLRSNLSAKDFNALVPSVSSLIRDYGIEPSVAFWISRPSIAVAIIDHDKATAEDKSQNMQEHIRAAELKELQDVDMINGDVSIMELKSTTNSTDDRDEPAKQNDIQDALMKDAPQPNSLSELSSVTAVAATTLSGPQYCWHPILQEVMESVRPALPEQIWEVLGEPFYFTFWQLSLGDMLVPLSSYEDEVGRQKRKLLAVSNDRSDISSAGTRLREQNKKTMNDLQDRLRAELKDHVSACSQTRSRLNREKDFWFANCWGKWDALNVALIEHCFIPRILISPVDSLYTFKMFKLLHSTGAKNFRTMGVLDHLFNGKRLTSLFFLCTAKEVENVGRFLNEILKDLGRWHVSKAVFEKEAYGNKRDLPGFRKNLKESTFWDYEDFRKVLQKWHMNLHNALKSCFVGGEYMHIRNAIIVLKAVVLHFPVINWMGQAQVASVLELSKSEAREDLKLVAMSLLGNLKRREKEWVLPQAFSLNKASSSTSSNSIGGSRSTPAKGSDTQQPDLIADGKSLNARAPDFVPSVRLQINGDGKPSGEKADVEDGEINDPTSATKATSPSSKPLVSPAHAGLKLHDATFDAVMSDRIDGPKQSNGTEKPLSPPPAAKQPELPSRPEARMPASGSSVPPRPPRPDAARNPSDLSSGGRPSHSLPTRPDPLPAPLRIGEQRGGDRLPRDGRDGRFSDNNRRGERAMESIRDQVSDRHGSYRTHERLPEKSVHNDRDRQDSIWGGERPPTSRLVDERYNMYSRDTRLPLHDERADRNVRERQHTDSFENLRGEISGHRSRDSSMPPPRSSLGPHPDRTGMVHATMDPDRLHGGTLPDRRGELSRFDDDSHFDSHLEPQRGSRTSSPSRKDERSSRPAHHHRDDRPSMDSRRQLEDKAPIRSRYDDSRPPTGPRTERHNDTPQSSAGDRFRESFKQSSSIAAPSDSSLGRLTQEPVKTRHQESQYGRLNTDPPSGPRIANGNQPSSSRGIRGVAAHLQGNVQAQSTPSTIQSANLSDKHTPMGPASGRLTSRNPTPYTRPPPISTSAPPTPSTESPDTAGVHPDRLKAMNFATKDAQEYSQPLSIPPVVSIVSAVPAGPRASSSSKTSSPITANRPIAGAPGFGNGERARGDKRFTNLNNVLQQAGGTTGPDRSSQGASIRGRGMRSNNLPTPPISSVPPRRESVINPEPFGSSRQELFSNRTLNGPNASQRDDDPVHVHAHGQLRDGDRRLNRRREGRSQSPRRHSGANPMIPITSNPRDEPRPTRRIDEQRDHRARPGEPQLMTERERRGPRDEVVAPNMKERERRDGDRRDDWVPDRIGQDRRERDRREPIDFASNGRKRPRATDDSYELGKRNRRTQ